MYLPNSSYMSIKHKNTRTHFLIRGANKGEDRKVQSRAVVILSVLALAAFCSFSTD